MSSTEKPTERVAHVVGQKVEDIGSYIRSQRELAQVSLRQLARSTGVSNPYLSQIERGLRKPSAEILQQIARGLRISAEALYVRAGILDERVAEGDQAILGERDDRERLINVLASEAERPGAPARCVRCADDVAARPVRAGRRGGASTAADAASGPRAAYRGGRHVRWPDRRRVRDATFLPYLSTPMTIVSPDTPATPAPHADTKRRVALGVTGGIAAYKAVDVCRRLVDAGAHVLAIKDMAGLLRAGAASKLVAALRDPVHHLDEAVQQGALGGGQCGGRRSVGDPHPRQEAQLYSLLGHRIGAGDDRLRSDDRRHAIDSGESVGAGRTRTRRGSWPRASIRRRPPRRWPGATGCT